MRYIFLLLVIGGSIAAFMLLVKPRYETLQKSRQELAQYQANIETAKKLEKSRQELINKYNTISKADLDNLKILLPDSVDNIRLIIQINEIATKNGLSVL